MVFKKLTDLILEVFRQSSVSAVKEREVISVKAAGLFRKSLNPTSNILTDALKICISLSPTNIS
ncbi:hypothetical protein AMJ48_00170 [Parcubacteria bacterium DG_74_1]|nr:MAG: hypothetical protein AMJ48_00170 [Parcubacteria bacterium DG_74_1]